MLSVDVIRCSAESMDSEPLSEVSAPLMHVQADFWHLEVANGAGVKVLLVGGLTQTW
jgi:hypothetical protein